MCCGPAVDPLTEEHPLLLKLTIHYAHQPSVSVRVPDMGLTFREWALAAYTATNAPGAASYGDVAGAAEVDHALRAGRHSRYWRRGLGPGDSVEILRKRMRCIAVDTPAGRPLGVPTFTEPVAEETLPGPLMHVCADDAPPDSVAYVEDERDRLWTGRGHGEWRCLTDPAGRTSPRQWASVWREHGPLTPLVPVQRVDEAEPVELGSHRAVAGRPLHDLTAE